MAGHPRQHGDLTGTRSKTEGLAVVEEAVCAAVYERLGEARFRLWFGDGVRLGLSGGGDTLEVQVPDPFFREWIQSHYTASLLEAAEAVVGRPLRILVRIYEETKSSFSAAIEGEPTHRKYDSDERHDSSITIPLPGNPIRSVCLSSSPLSTSSASLPPRRSRLRQEDEHQAPKGTQTVWAGNAHAATASPSRRARTLDDYVTGAGNRLAHAAAKEIAEWGSVPFNPLVIHSAGGLGKTHLLEGISFTLKQAHPTLQIIHLTAETFTNSFLESMRAGSLGGFRARLRNASGLIIDDVHFLAAKRATMVEFLHTFDALFSRGAPIVLAADHHPRLISKLTDELVTRFLAGMVVKIEAPDLATRRAILQAKATARGINVPEAVIAYIAEHVRASIRELEGALHSVIAQAALIGKRLDLNLAKTALRDTIRHATQAIALRDVEQAVCQLFQISTDALKSDSRARALAYPRMMAMYLARKHTGAAYGEIGRHFGSRNHSTVISSEKKVESWLRAEERSILLPGFETVADLLADLEQTLGA
jgi:chromosomal replication initiator protein